MSSQGEYEDSQSVGHAPEIVDDHYVGLDGEYDISDLEDGAFVVFVSWACNLADEIDIGRQVTWPVPRPCVERLWVGMCVWCEVFDRQTVANAVEDKRGRVAAFSR